MPTIGKHLVILACAAFSHAWTQSAVQAQSTLKVLGELRDHDVVIHAKILEVGKSPGFWSGAFVSTQRVRYAVLGVFKGDVKAETVSVDHVLVGGGSVEDVEPQLSPKIMTVGTEVLLFASKSFPCRGDGLFIAGDDPFGVLLVRDDQIVLPKNASAKTR